MRIYVKNHDGEMVEAFQVNENTYTFESENKTFNLFLTESNDVPNFSTLSDEHKKQITKAIFSNDEILEQLSDAKKKRNRDISYYSGDEIEFDHLVDEMNRDR